MGTPFPLTLSMFDRRWFTMDRFWTSDVIHNIIAIRCLVSHLDESIFLDCRRRGARKTTHLVIVDLNRLTVCWRPISPTLLKVFVIATICWRLRRRTMNKKKYDGLEHKKISGTLNGLWETKFALYRSLGQSDAFKAPPSPTGDHVMMLLLLLLLITSSSSW